MLLSFHAHVRNILGCPVQEHVPPSNTRRNLSSLIIKYKNGLGDLYSESRANLDMMLWILSGGSGMAAIDFSAKELYRLVRYWFSRQGNNK